MCMVRRVVGGVVGVAAGVEALNRRVRLGWGVLTGPAEGMTGPVCEVTTVVVPAAVLCVVMVVRIMAASGRSGS